MGRCSVGAVARGGCLGFVRSETSSITKQEGLMTTPSSSKISDRTAERLNALMRPAKAVPWSASTQGLLATIGEDRDPAAALAYVFANKPFATLSGEPTPASEFPKPFDQSPGSADTQDFEAFQRDAKIPRRLVAVTAQIEADEPDAAERAQRAWTFLQSVKSRVGRAAVLATMLEHEAFVSSAMPFTGEVRFGEQIEDREYDDILWRNRDAIAALRGIDASDVLKTKTGTGAAAYSVLSGIRDERDRAVVFGYYLGQRSGVRAIAIDLVGALSGLAEQVREAAENGEPCPSCGEVHSSGASAHENE